MQFPSVVNRRKVFLRKETIFPEGEIIMKSEWKPAGRFNPSRSFVEESDPSRDSYEQFDSFDLGKVRWRGPFEGYR